MNTHYSLPPNTQHRWARLFWLISVAGIVMVALPAAGMVDIYRGGGAMILIGVWLAAVGLIVGMMFRARARAHDAIVGAAATASGDSAGTSSPVETPHATNCLAHWTYEFRPWMDHVEQELQQQRAEKWAIWRIVAVFCLVIGGIFVVAEPRGAGPTVALVLLGVLGLLAVVIQLATAVPYRHHRRNAGQVYIGRDGILYNGTLHVWRGWGARLERVVYPDAHGNLAVNYSTPARYGRQYQNVRVPIPAGHHDQAEQIAAQLRQLAHRR